MGIIGLMKTHTYKGITWIEAFSPKETVLNDLSETYDIDYFITNDILSPTPYLYNSRHGDALYAVFHFPIFRLDNDKKSVELDLIIKNKFLMTVNYDAIDSLDILSKKIETEEGMPEENGKTLPAPTLANVILKEMYMSMLNDLASLSDWIHDIEDRVYEGKEKEMVTEISLVAREIAEFRSKTHEHAQQLETLEAVGTQMFGADFTHSYEGVMRTFKQVQSQILFLTEIVTELRETNNSLVSTKQNEIMKVLTIMAFITFPLSLIASIFGMNTIDIPLVGQDGDFVIIMGIMGVSTLCMFAFFKYKKWI